VPTCRCLSGLASVLIRAKLGDYRASCPWLEEPARATAALAAGQGLDDRADSDARIERAEVLRRTASSEGALSLETCRTRKTLFAGRRLL